LQECFCFERLWIHVARIIFGIIPHIIIAVKLTSTIIPLRAADATVPVIDISEQERHPMTTRCRILVSKASHKTKIAIGVQMIVIALYELW